MPSAIALSIVVIQFKSGDQEAWGFPSPSRALDFFEALDYHPSVSIVERTENGFTFNYGTSTDNTVRLDPNVRYQPLEAHEWSEDCPHGEFDTTAVCMGGVAVRLHKPAPVHVTPRRLRALGVDAVN